MRVFLLFKSFLKITHTHVLVFKKHIFPFLRITFYFTTYSWVLNKDQFHLLFHLQIIWDNRHTSKDSFPKLVVGLICFNSKAYPIQSEGGL